MKRSFSLYALIILWTLPAAGQDVLLGTWEGTEEGVELATVEEDGTFYVETVEGETTLRATFAEDNSCQLDTEMRFVGVDAFAILSLALAGLEGDLHLVDVADAEDSTIDLGALRQLAVDALASPHGGYSMTFAWMGTYSTEGNSVRLDIDEAALYLGDTEAGEFFIKFFAEILGSDDLPDDLVERITSHFGGTPERGWTIAAEFSSDSGNLVFPHPNSTADTFDLTRVSSPTAVAPISWGDLKDRW